MGDRDGRPILPGASATTQKDEDGAKRSDLHRQAMRRSLGFKSDQLEEAPEEPVLLPRHAASLGTAGDAKEDWSKKGRNGERHPSSDGIHGPKRRLSW